MAKKADGSAPAAVDESALFDATRVAEDPEVIRDVLRDAAWRHAREHQAPLTPAQVRVLQILVDELRDSGAGVRALRGLLTAREQFEGRDARGSAYRSGPQNPNKEDG